jgi:uroporphyrinogen decarboxylase
MCGYSLASPDVISYSTYEKYVLPFERKVFEAIKPVCRKNDAVTVLHICGDTTSIMPLMCQTGADVMEVDYKVDLGKVMKLYGSKVSFMGNIDPSAILLQGSPEAVKETANKCIADATKCGGFILGSGCEVAPATPLENIKAMVEAARSYRY